jgi:CheY-like chemotaxis protein
LPGKADPAFAQRIHHERDAALETVPVEHPTKVALDGPLLDCECGANLLVGLSPHQSFEDLAFPPARRQGSRASGFHLGPAERGTARSDSANGVCQGGEGLALVDKAVRAAVHRGADHLGLGMRAKPQDCRSVGSELTRQLERIALGKFDVGDDDIDFVGCKQLAGSGEIGGHPDHLDVGDTSKGTRQAFADKEMVLDQYHADCPTHRLRLATRSTGFVTQMTQPEPPSAQPMQPALVVAGKPSTAIEGRARLAGAVPAGCFGDETHPQFEEAVTVAVVDDDELIRSMVVRVLGNAGVRTLAYSSADEALDAILVSDASIECVVSDISMPGKLDGLGLARELDARRPGMPVVLMSGTPQLLAESASIGSVRATLAKPFDIQIVVPVVVAARGANSRSRA